jgi:hypothetical protein
VQTAHLIGLEIERKWRGSIEQRERDDRVSRDPRGPVRRNRERQRIPEIGDPGRAFLRQRFRDAGFGNPPVPDAPNAPLATAPAISRSSANAMCRKGK